MFARRTMEARLGIGRLSLRILLKIFSLAFLCFFLASSSWAQQDDSYPSEKAEPAALEKNTPSEKDELPTQEQKAPSDQGDFLNFRQKTLEEKAPSAEGDLLTFGQKIPLEKELFFTGGQKALLLNVGSIGTIFIYGLARWDYAKSKFIFKNEGWFARTSKYGGADKLGHLWSNYAMSHLYAYIYRKWGFTDNEANLYGALSSLGANFFMEIFDGFSPSQGFSYEDMVMNIVGCGLGYVWGRYPSLANKIDFRIEYLPDFTGSHIFGFSTDYERQKFLIAIKADGFDFIKNPYLKYLEFHVGYYARGYRGYEEGVVDYRRRRLFVGIGFNVSKLVQKYVNTTVLNYIQIPYTAIDFPIKLD